MSWEVEAWLRKTRADLKAGSSRDRGTDHCHRRYWLQQAYEKGIKALERLLWSAKTDPEAEKALRTNFLSEHSPLRELFGYVTNPPKKGAHPELVRFQRQLDAELIAIDHHGVLRRVDDTKPSRNPLDRSYRYPFQDGTGSFRAPCDCKAAEWEAYQGAEPP